MATPLRLSASLTLRARESARRRRERDLKVESLEPRLAMATGLLSTLVSVVRDDSSHSLLSPGATAEIAEGQELAASVRLTRRPDSAILVSLKSLAPLEVAAPATTLRFTIRGRWKHPRTPRRSLESGRHARVGDEQARGGVCVDGELRHRLPTREPGARAGRVAARAGWSGRRGGVVAAAIRAGLSSASAG